MNASITANPKRDYSPEDLRQQVETLRADVIKFASSIAGDVSDGMDAAGRLMGHIGRSARASASNAVIEHPLAAVGFVAMVGLLIGMMSRRG